MLKLKLFKLYYDLSTPQQMYSYNCYFLYKNYSFLGKFGDKILSKYASKCIKMHQNAPNCTCLQFFSKEYMLPNGPSMRAAIITLFLYENSHFLVKISLKYTLKRINCNMFSKIISGNKCPITSV